MTTSMNASLKRKFSQSETAPKKLRFDTSWSVCLPECPERNIQTIFDTEEYYIINSQKLKRGKPFCLIFFGFVSPAFLTGLEILFQQYEARVTFMAITTASIFTELQPYSFPMVADINGTIIKHFKVLDPLGGGVFPRNCMVLLDKRGCKVSEFLLYEQSMRCHGTGSSVEIGMIPAILEDFLCGRAMNIS